MTFSLCIWSRPQGLEAAVVHSYVAIGMHGLYQGDLSGALMHVLINTGVCAVAPVVMSVSGTWQCGVWGSGLDSLARTAAVAPVVMSVSGDNAALSTGFQRLAQVWHLQLQSIGDHCAACNQQNE